MGKNTGNSKRSSSSHGWGKHRHVTVRAVHRNPPDIKKMSRALVAFALAQAEADAEAEERERTARAAGNDSQDGTEPASSADADAAVEPEATDEAAHHPTDTNDADASPGSAE